MLPRLAEASAEIGLPFEAVPLERLGAEADVIITITSGFAPILMRDQVKPGTHIAAMGTDTKGKQELDPALVATARVFTDEVAQAVSIGECQHAVAGGLLAADASPRLARWSRAFRRAARVPANYAIRRHRDRLAGPRRRRCRRVHRGGAETWASNRPLAGSPQRG
jgi:Ornithine cyclodeaminase/mu-crystallin family